jgi:hypothetical protein
MPHYKLLKKQYVLKTGSAQEFVEVRILGCFLEGHEFGLGHRHALSFQKQVA